MTWKTVANDSFEVVGFIYWGALSNGSWRPNTLSRGFAPMVVTEREREREQRILTEIQSVPGDLYISHHITSCHIISCHIISYHIYCTYIVNYIYR